MRTSVMAELVIDHDDAIDVEGSVQTLAGEMIADFFEDGRRVTAVIDEVRIVEARS